MTRFIFISVILTTFILTSMCQTTPRGNDDSTIWTPYYLSSTAGYNFNENQERFARQLQASLQNPFNNGHQNGQQNQNVRNYQNPFERQNENNRFDNRNGQQQQNNYEYPSQFFQRRNTNTEYPSNQYGQRSYGPGNTQLGNQGQYNRPQPYESGFYQSTRSPQQHYGIGQQQQIIQQLQQQQTDRQRSRMGNQQSQGFMQQNGAYNHENQGGLSEYHKQVYAGMYGKKK